MTQCGIYSLIHAGSLHFVFRLCHNQGNFFLNSTRAFRDNRFLKGVCG